MRRVLLFIISCLVLTHGSDAAVRDGSVAIRAKSGDSARTTTQRLKSTTVQKRDTSPRATTTRTSTTPRTTEKTKNTARSGDIAVRKPVYSTPVKTPAVISRAADSSAISQTRTGAEYEQCKTAYFTCMDQFCSLKNDDYRRCSCSNRIYDFQAARETLNQANEQLTIFTENIDAVGLTAAQAAAMKTASEGEDALTADKSASKALLQAIMNSIRGEDATVGGKYTDLNSINISFDTANAFGTMDAGQAIAAYDGQNLYNAVYPQCRDAVRADCNDASLQRAITAYLMSIEQDCNTVQTAIENTKKDMKAAVREGSAMLDLARVENRQKHNSDDIATCINNVETAILNDQVCGPGYKKCLDNGKYIDIKTGNAIPGVVDFYKLEEMLSFSSDKSISEQKLSKINKNRTFVENFEKRTKKFATDALDKCTENADIVWAEYLDKALLDIYYAQKAKVNQIKQGCFDFVSTCYMNGEESITAAMKELTGDSGVLLQPDKIALSGALCTDYVNSCNKMFDGDIVAQYIQNRQNTDTLTACRAVVKQCFDNFGGTNYENFYYPYSGLFETGNAIDWFTLYEEADDGDIEVADWPKKAKKAKYKSTCAKQLLDIDACASPEMIAAAFGGMDKLIESDDDTKTTNTKYGLYNDKSEIAHRHSRPTGVATEVYNQIVDILTTQCMNMRGYFVERQFGAIDKYKPENLCELKRVLDNDVHIWYFIAEVVDDEGTIPSSTENMCPRDYSLSVDTESWGICSCWENGARRSKNGTTTKCEDVTIVSNGGDEEWEQSTTNNNNQVCPKESDNIDFPGCDNLPKDVPVGLDM